MIALVDYGAGNLTSVRKGFAAAGAEMFTPASPSEISRASAIVVPGVGHFRATAGLEDGWRAAIRHALQGGTPLLGICLGLQWLYEGSAEAPEVAGLGALDGLCVRIDAEPPLKVPHVGWNVLRVRRPSRLLDGIADGTHVYFTHSYAPPVTDVCVATTLHGAEFCAAASHAHVHGVQFHPEKSGEAGVRVLRNFIALCGHAV